MKKITKLLAVLALVLQPFMLVSCKDDDIPNDVPGGEDDWIVQTEDVVETYLDGDIALVGSHFDEVTSYILSRVCGQKFQIDFSSSSLPVTTRVLMIDDENMRNLSADDIDRLIVPAYRQGVIMCMHKPSDWKAAGVQMALWQVDHGTDGSETIEGSDQNVGRSAFTTRSTDDGMDYDDSSSDLIAIKPGGLQFKLDDVYNPDEKYESTIQITEHIDESEPATRDSLITITPQEPTAYEYGRFAENAVKWINETQEEALFRAARAGSLTRSADGTTNMSQVCNETRIVSCTFWNRYGNPNTDAAYVKKDYNVNIPLIIRAYTTSAYNFDTDEDYYHVVMEEEFDASKLYRGRFDMREKNMYIAGYT